MPIRLRPKTKDHKTNKDEGLVLDNNSEKKLMIIYIFIKEILSEDERAPVKNINDKDIDLSSNS